MTGLKGHMHILRVDKRNSLRLFYGWISVTRSVYFTWG